MKSTDRGILLGLAIVGLLAAFWFLVLSPKRHEAAQLNSEVSALRAQVEQQEQDAAAGELAKQDFATNYRKLVALGKAVPADADTPTLLTQLQILSERANVDFRSISLATGSGGAAPAAAPAPVPAPAPTDSTATTDASTTTDATATAVPTETAAALLPIGATVGPAGLPVMPYAMQFNGGFFQIADFFGELDGMVTPSGENVDVNGRLLTIDGFELTAGPKNFPDLSAAVQATSYLTPADQGLSAGATPSGPLDATTTDASAPVPDPSAPVPSATVTP